MKVEVILSLLNKSDLLVINNKVDEEKGIFEPNMNVRDSINW